MAGAQTKALTFDVFGTVVDWRGSVAREVEAFGRARGVAIDGSAFALAWRQRYQPAMARVRSGDLPWTRLDDLHRMNLREVLAEFAIEGVSEEDLERLNRIWHRLDPWPDVVEGLTRLKPHYILATLSNGNISLMVDLARHAGLPWDAVLGAEIARHYKPDPQAYLVTAASLDLRPAQCLMVAAHNSDLAAASALGFRCAFVPRPSEYGPGQTSDLEAERPWDVIAASFGDLAAKLGC